MSWGMMAEQLRWSVMEDEGWRKGPWTAEEDRLLIEYVKLHGEGRWNSVARLAGLKRNGKSCRLRWVNYLRPDLKRGQITPHEENIILELHARWGNRWSTIARSLPGRTDNEIKNYWRTHFKKKAKASPNTNGKAKVRLLRKQQFQQQQQREQQINQMETNRIASLLDNENDNKSVVSFLPETRGEIATPYQNSIEDQGFFYPLFNGCYAAHMNEAPNHEDNNLWDGLWNLDDFHGNLGMSCGANKVGLIHTNLATPFY